MAASGSPAPAGTAGPLQQLEQAHTEKTWPEDQASRRSVQIDHREPPGPATSACTRCRLSVTSETSFAESLPCMPSVSRTGRPLLVPTSTPFLELSRVRAKSAAEP
jgi:hypothetical protein